ncbi:hypothetical protein D1B31_05465 [Neobacillus notoginsengisoli]|uniref:DUF2157 domain-containing protein n=1 Tax=Neobacillus notoginsengisoli TaxID=1578198 RepID=A0A417YX06_9BACI|nr:hypothetical protein [Neobacillus notoginsengisoli]RHW42086.1 hypothetical protein D1B31_05465 [Neobacillus notoginsengisoli]
MEPHFRSEARRIFRRELFNMKEEGYLPSDVVDEVAKAHVHYHQDLLAEDRKREAARVAERKQQIPIQNPQTVKAAAPVQRPPVPIKPKRILTSEQIRERNISWLLNIGVIFLLIGGLFVATSNWETMTPVMKSSSIALVSLLFYGFAYLSVKVLKIEKTAFAFIVLGSLFLPIYVLSLGWFGLLGPYLSVNGEGRYLLGFSGSILPACAYAFFASKLKSRLFVWFTFIATSVGTGFLLAALDMPIDYFYLGIMAYNAVIIFLFFKVRGREPFRLFAKEFPVFIQANLVISTLLLLFFFDNQLVYSFNLLLTAVIYLSMMYVSGRKEYHFIFSAMLVYGAYQLIENSFLESGSAIFYALLAFGFVLVPKALKGNLLLERAFRLTSAAISVLAFLYITIEGISLRSGEPSFILVIAYLIIAGNFLYLTHAEKERLFPYLSALFLGTAVHEAIALFSKHVYPLSQQTAIFTAGLMVFFLIGFMRANRTIAPLKNPSRDLGLATMLLAVVLTQGVQNWFELGIMLAILAAAALAVTFAEKRFTLQKMAVWAVPVSLGLSVLAFGQEAGLIWPVIWEKYSHPVYFSTGGVLLLALTALWRKRGSMELTGSFFYTGQLFYTLGLLLSAIGECDPVIVRPVLVFGALAVYWLLYRTHRLNAVAFLLSAVSLGFYYSIMSSASNLMHLSGFAKTILIPGGAAFLLLLALGFKRRDGLLFQSFAWTGHTVLPAALMLVWAAYPDWCIYSLAVAVAIYGVSSSIAKEDWKEIVFMYAAFTSGYLSLSKGFELAWSEITAVYAFPVTSLMVLIVWFALKGNLKKWAAYYFTAFSMLGIAFLTFTYPFTMFPYAVTILYAAGTLVFLHKMKWDLLGIVPISFVIFATMEYLTGARFTKEAALALYGTLGLIHLFTGKFVYRQLAKLTSQIENSIIDWYTIASLFFFGSMYAFNDSSIWFAPLPGLLLSFAIWLQRDRVGTKAGFFLPIGAGAFLLQPYYEVIGHLDIPSLFEMEAVVLPFVALVIFLRKSLKGRYTNLTGKLQWAVLVFTALVLIQDGLQSNTIYDALLLGTLSLISMLAGMFLRIKSYFFTGAGVLLLNLFLQTRPFWGNLPWWGYLLAVGSLLIGIASYNEWKKTNQGEGKEPLGTRFKRKLEVWLKDWH